MRRSSASAVRIVENGNPQKNPKEKEKPKKITQYLWYLWLVSAMDAETRNACVREMKGDWMIAYADDVDLPDEVVGLHQSHHALDLERFGPIGSSRVGNAEEYHVRDVDIEATDEQRNEVVPLPHCVGSDPVDEEYSRLGLLVRFGDPAMHDGAVAEIGGGRFQAGVGEGVVVAPVSRSSEAETTNSHALLILILTMFLCYLWKLLFEQILLSEIEEMN
ncbi:hypothetical protein G2W53_028568 [Senna tora]|uniref:Uncharacterized protein n=1 Tax=Senna tora TaxID=362788 RepID=A0A834T2K0_9FABA|nr:hypothetical protein G2W53_028568 [Senna tora]